MFKIRAPALIFLCASVPLAMAGSYATGTTSLTFAVVVSAVALLVALAAVRELRREKK
jgi:hypothetical protein